MRGFLLLLFLCMFLGVDAQDINYVYPQDLRYYKETEWKVKLPDSVIIYRGYVLKEKGFNGLYYFYDSVNSKQPSRIILYNKGKTHLKKKFPDGCKHWVPYYDVRYFYNKWDGSTIVETRDSSYVSSTHPSSPSAEKYYDRSGNLLWESKMRFFYNDNKVANRLEMIGYYKNGKVKQKSTSMWPVLTKDESYYSPVTECFDSVSGCKIKEEIHSLINPEFEIYDYVLQSYYEDTTYKYYSNCNINPDSIVKRVVISTVYNRRQAEYRNDTLIKNVVEWKYKADPIESYSNISTKDYFQLDVMYDSLGNLIYTHLIDTLKHNISEKIYHFHDHKNYLAMNAVINNKKRIERYYNPNGNLYMKCVYRKGKLKREKQY